MKPAAPVEILRDSSLRREPNGPERNGADPMARPRKSTGSQRDSGAKTPGPGSATHRLLEEGNRDRQQHYSDQQEHDHVRPDRGEPGAEDHDLP